MRTLAVHVLWGVDVVLFRPCQRSSLNRDSGPNALQSLRIFEGVG